MTAQDDQAKRREKDDLITLEIMRSLYERHPAFRGWWEPVYGKKFHIGDTCKTCGTHFRGLEDDIKLLVNHYLATERVDELERLDHTSLGNEDDDAWFDAVVSPVIEKRIAELQRRKEDHGSNGQ